MMSFFFFSSRRRHTRLQGDWSSDVCSSDLGRVGPSATLNSFWSQPHASTVEPRMPSGDHLIWIDLEMTGLKPEDRKSTRLNSSHLVISYAVFCLKKKKKKKIKQVQ